MNNPSFGIERIETYLPPKRLSSEELATQFGFDLNFVEEKIGVKQLFVVEGEKTSDIAVRAMNQLLAVYPSLRAELDVLVVCTQTPDYQLPQVSALVQSRCKLPRSVASFDVGLGCSGFVYALNVVESVLACNGLNKGVLITSETYSRIINSADRNTKCLFSDGAAATLITRQGNIQSGVSRFGTDGDYHDRLIVKPAEDGKGMQPLYMDGRSIFEFAVSTIPNEVRLTCEANNVSMDEIDFFVLHQASKFVLDAIAKKMKIQDSARMINVLHLTGNTVSSSIPMALKETLAQHGKRDLKILISGFGVGLSWGTTLLTTKGDCSNV